jgi:integrase
MIPTIDKVMKTYVLIAQAERAKTGRPGEETVKNVLRGTVLVCAAAGISTHCKVTSLTRKNIDKALGVFVSRGLSRLTALSYISKLQGLFARWCQPYYKDANWEIPPLELPTFRAQAPRYERPSPELLSKVKNWYKTLKNDKWVAATMMLEFGMRNSDVLRLTEANFIKKDKARFLQYTPHKTELSSGRRVFWPIHEDIWKRIKRYGGIRKVDVTTETFHKINAELRGLGFTGSKASYELRKICIDHIYQKFGAEMAVSISGDDIKTIIKYYADPSQPNVGAVKIVDLI